MSLHPFRSEMFLGLWGFWELNSSSHLLSFALVGHISSLCTDWMLMSNCLCTLSSAGWVMFTDSRFSCFLARVLVPVFYFCSISLLLGEAFIRSLNFWAKHTNGILTCIMIEFSAIQGLSIRNLNLVLFVILTDLTDSQKLVWFPHRLRDTGKLVLSIPIKLMGSHRVQIHKVSVDRVLCAIFVWIAGHMVGCHWITEFTTILGGEPILTLALLERSKCLICFMKCLGFLFLGPRIVITLTWLCNGLSRSFSIIAAPIRWIKAEFYIQKIVEKHILISMNLLYFQFALFYFEYYSGLSKFD